MNNNTLIEFYHSKMRLIIGSILFPLFAGLLIFALIETDQFNQDIFLILLSLAFIALFGFATIANILALIKGSPYLIMTDSYLQINQQRLFRTSKTIKFNLYSITSLETYKVGGLPTLKISYRDQKKMSDKKISKIELTLNSLKKEDRIILLERLDNIIQGRAKSTYRTIDWGRQSRTERKKIQKNAQKKFLEKYSTALPVHKTLDKTYIVNSYIHGLIAFAVSLFFFFTGSQNTGFLAWLILSLILFPLAKIPFDWLIGFRIQESMKMERASTLGTNRLLAFVDFVLFFLSPLVAPFVAVILIVLVMALKIMDWVKEKKN